MTRNSRDSIFQRWTVLLEAVHETKADLAGVAPFLEAFARAYATALTNRVLRAAARDSAKKATKRLKASMAQGGDAAICLRNFIKVVLGPRSEKLHRYGIHPLSKGRSPRQKQIGFDPPN